MMLAGVTARVRLEEVNGVRSLQSLRLLVAVRLMIRAVVVMRPYIIVIGTVRTVRIRPR